MASRRSSSSSSATRDHRRRGSDNSGGSSGGGGGNRGNDKMASDKFSPLIKKKLGHKHNQVDPLDAEFVGVSIGSSATDSSATDNNNVGGKDRHRRATDDTGRFGGDLDSETDEDDDESDLDRAHLSGGGRPRVAIDRLALNEKQLQERFQYEPACKPWTANRVWARAAQKCRKWSPLDTLVSLLPILVWLPKYRWRKDLPSDLSAGFTVAVMHIPQGMAYALLANTDPIVGIYTAFFPVIVYIFIGTSAHISLGTFAVMSILTSNSVSEFATKDFGDGSADKEPKEGEQEYSSVQVVTAVAFAAGCFQIVFYLLRLSSLCSLLSHSLIRGFTTGAAIHVFSSQVKYILGIKVERYNGPLALFKMYVELFGKLGETNPVTVGISMTVIVGLELYAQFVDKRLTRLLHGVNFPIHLLFVLLGILVSYLLDLEDEYKVKVVGEVQSGMPTPELPPLTLFPGVAVNALIIAIVSYVVTYSLATLFAERHRYKIDASQELLANGVCNVAGSFFSCLPVSTSLSRTSVQDDAGCKTLLTSATSAFILLWVLLFAGPVFKPLPNAVLSAIIVQALKGMFKQFADLPPLWRTSIMDLLIWVVTFVATVVLGVDLGLLVGVAVNLVILIYWCLTPRLEVLSETDYIDLNLNQAHFHDVHDAGRILMVRLTGCFNFSNSTRIQGDVEHLVEKTNEEAENDKSKPRYLLLDVTGVSSLDLSACISLSTLCKNLRVLHRVKLCLIGVSGHVWHKLEMCKVFEELHRHRCFPTPQDAIAVLEEKAKKTQ